MEHVALYRKYRPCNFENLVGQDFIKTTLTNALKTERVSHAYLFSGPRGTGKTSTARLLAKALNCTSLKDNIEPCNKCEFCSDINEGRLIDLVEIDAASNRGIDEVRDLREKINFAPTRSKYKIYIIDEVHMMTKEAFNALLKTLEEPPSHAYFILATTEIHKIPETIISRCQRFDFKRISQKALMTRLGYIAQMEKITAEDKALFAISKYVDGGLRDAIGFVEQLTTDNKLLYEHVQDILGISDSSLLDQLLDSLNSKNTKNALDIIHKLHDQGSDLKKFAHDFIENLRDKMISSIFTGNIKETDRFMRMIEIFQETQEKMYSVSIPQLSLEIAVIKVSGPVKTSNEDVVEVDDVVEVPEASEKSTNSLKPILKSPDGLNINFLKENWPRITERIKSPSLRMSLKNAVPFKMEEHDVTLMFGTTFHKNKVMEHEHKVELENMIKEVSDCPVKILALVRAIEIKPLVEKTSPEDNAFSDALDVFGGEIVE
jgi:DNA polymerase-3 subunit gamma/tau